VVTPGRGDLERGSRCRLAPHLREVWNLDRLGWNRLDVIARVDAARNFHGVRQRPHRLHPQVVPASSLGHRPNREKTRFFEIASHQCGPETAASGTHPTVESKFTECNDICRTGREFPVRGKHAESDR
jgi:hypothetical protein